MFNFLSEISEITFVLKKYMGAEALPHFIDREEKYSTNLIKKRFTLKTPKKYYGVCNIEHVCIKQRKKW